MTVFAFTLLVYIFEGTIIEGKIQMYRRTFNEEYKQFMRYKINEMLLFVEFIENSIFFVNI